MKFNKQQEEVILENLSVAVPQLDANELWYGFIQPFFNGVEVNLNGTPKLADSSDELAQKIRVLAVDLLLRKVKQYSSNVAEQEYIVQHVSPTLLSDLALMMGQAISAALSAIVRSSFTLR